MKRIRSRAVSFCKGGGSDREKGWGPDTEKLHVKKEGKLHQQKREYLSTSGRKCEAEKLKRGKGTYPT